MVCRTQTVIANERSHALAGEWGAPKPLRGRHPQRAIRAIGLIAVIIASSSCSGSFGAPHRSRAAMDHGIGVGSRVRPLTLQCDQRGSRDSGNRAQVSPVAPSVRHLTITLGDPKTTSIVSFATPADCSACDLHVAGMNMLTTSESLPIPDFIVLWPGADFTPTRHAAIVAATPRVVCFDETGAAWDAQDIRHTPFTVVIQRGTVAYIHDRSLVRALERAEFMSDLRAVLATKLDN